MERYITIKIFLYVIHKKEGMGYLCQIDSDGSGREDVCALFAMDKFSSVSLVFHENDIYAYDSVGNAGGSENHVQEIKENINRGLCSVNSL